MKGTVIWLDIKEVEGLLSVSRANIRFYEKEGLIAPRRKSNNYRDFSDNDINELRKIVTLRKLGFSIQEIAMMQRGELALGSAAADNIARLEKEISELRDAVEMTQMIADDGAAYEDFDSQKYRRIIDEREKRGAKFKDICLDCVKFEISMFDTMWKRTFFHDFKKSRKKHGIIVAVLILLAICIMRGISSKFLWQSTFWEGFLYPFILFAAVSLIILPLHIFTKISPKAGSMVAGILLIVCLLFLALLIIGVILLMFNSVFHFWF